MAGSKVSNFAIGDSNIQNVMLTLDKTFKGQHQVSLTNYDTTAESQVAAGSVIEIGGALYKFDSNESITGTPSDGTVYIMAVPSGDSVTCAYTNTAPTWSDSKQGWYGTGATANNRYLEFIMTKLSTAYQFKNSLTIDNSKKNLSVFGYFTLSTPSSFTESAKLTFNTKQAEQNILYDTSTKILTIQSDGFYNFSLSPALTGATAGFYYSRLFADRIYNISAANTILTVSGTGTTISTFPMSSFPVFGSSGNITVALTAGTTVSPDIIVSGSTTGTQGTSSFLIIKKIA